MYQRHQVQSTVWNYPISGEGSGRRFPRQAARFVFRVFSKFHLHIRFKGFQNKRSLLTVSYFSGPCLSLQRLFVREKQAMPGAASCGTGAEATRTRCRPTATPLECIMAPAKRPLYALVSTVGAAGLSRCRSVADILALVAECHFFTKTTVSKRQTTSDSSMPVRRRRTVRACCSSYTPNRGRCSIRRLLVAAVTCVLDIPGRSPF